MNSKQPKIKVSYERFFIYDPSINALLLHVTISCEKLKDSIDRIVDILRKYGVKLLRFYAHPIHDSANVSLTLYIGSKNKVPEKIVSELKEIFGSENVLTEEPVLPGLLVDNIHHPLVFLGEPIVIFDAHGLRAIFVNLVKRYGEALKAILWHEGYAMGESIIEGIIDVIKKLKFYDKAYDFDFIMKLFLRVLAAHGWFNDAKLEKSISLIKGVVSETITVKVQGSIECVYQEKSNTSRSNILRGMLAGAIFKLKGKRYIVEERKCIAKGDPYCEFFIYPA